MRGAHVLVETMKPLAFVWMGILEKEEYDSLPILSNATIFKCYLKPALNTGGIKTLQIKHRVLSHHQCSPNVPLSLEMQNNITRDINLQAIEFCISASSKLWQSVNSKLLK